MRLLQSLGFVFLIGCFASLEAAEKNIVVFVTDDQSPDAGCYGNPVIKTPHLDQLAAEGVKFNHAFCTTASCSASRSVILTGLFNHANAHYGHKHSYHHFSSYDWVKSLPVLLGKAGYRTARVGKYHVAPEEVYAFDQAIAGSSRNPVQMANNSKEFIEADDERPFFLYFCTSDPHRGGGIVENSPYKPNRFGNQDKPREGLKNVTYDPKEVIVPEFLPDTPTARAEIAQYYQSISRIDQGLGRLIEILKDADVYDDTLIVYTSDHGMAFPGGKTTVYEGGLRVPFIVRNPYSKAQGTECNALISHVDITPTMLNFAGGLDRKTGAAKAEIATRPGRKPQPYVFHGKSWLEVLDKENPEGWDEIRASHTFHEITMYYPMRVVRNREYKLIWNIAHPLPYPFASDLWAAPTWQDRYQKGPDTYYGKRTVHEYIHRPKFELYKISTDPHESENLAADPDHQKVLEQMKQELKRFQQQTQDPWALKWKYE